MTGETGRCSSRWFQQVARWAPTAVLIVAAVLLGGALRLGGLPAVYAWNLLPVVLPALGLMTLIFEALAELLPRRWRAPAAGWALAIGALVPAVQLVAPIVPFPAGTATPIALVRLPVDEPVTVLWGGDRLRVNQHAAFPDQRWAYDLAVPPVLTSSARLEDYGCYGVTVVAPAASFVKAAHDGEPEASPGTLSRNFAAPLGNHVVLELETGTYLVIAHMRTGSVRVHDGDRLSEGEAIGQCGNSGNTSEPHVHIHHQRQDPTTHLLNFAEGLPLLFRDYDGPPVLEGGISVEDGRAIANGAVARHVGR